MYRPQDTLRLKGGWAILIKRIYQADPLLCPKCGGTMKIVALIEAQQDDVIHKILHIAACGATRRPAPRPSLRTHPPQVRSLDPGFTCEPDPDFLEHVRREESDQPEGVLPPRG